MNTLLILHVLLNKLKVVPGVARLSSYLVSGKRGAAIEKISLQDIPDSDIQGGCR